MLNNAKQHDLIEGYDKFKIIHKNNSSLKIHYSKNPYIYRRSLQCIHALSDPITIQIMVQEEAFFPTFEWDKISVSIHIFVRCHFSS